MKASKKYLKYLKNEIENNDGIDISEIKRYGDYRHFESILDSTCEKEKEISKEIINKMMAEDNLR